MRNIVLAAAMVVSCGGKLDTSVLPEGGLDATKAADAEGMDGGTMCVQFDGSSPPLYTSGIGCFSNGDPSCAADEFSVVCVGALPQTPIPAPPDAGDCTIVGIPTPENVLFWCCRCAF